MCGFLGFTNDFKDNKKIMHKMLNTIKHRGPDSEDIFTNKDITLGFRRLSIIDLSEKGSQPMFNEDKNLVLVFNGEIYNHEDIKKDLIKRGHVFSSKTDSEVLLHGYEEYGKNLLNKLRGMFAFVIYDIKSKKIFAARDFFGIKPLYYAKMEKSFIFGSEIKGFLDHPAFIKELDEDKLPEYLVMTCLSGENTFFKNVYKLMPGHYLEYDGKKLKIQRYFNPLLTPNKEKSFDHYVKKIDKIFSESVEAHKISDVEIGSFLSSGVDSSYVASKMKGTKDFKTYTVGFSDDEYSELKPAREFAEYFGLKNKGYVINPKEFFEMAGSIQYYMDEPLANSSANPLYFVTKEASKDLKVALSGEGADEMFGGYPPYWLPKKLEKYRKVPLFIRKPIALIAKIMPKFKGRAFLIKGGYTIDKTYLSMVSEGDINLFDNKSIARITKKKYSKFNPHSLSEKYYKMVEKEDEVTKMQFVDINVWMIDQILLKADKMSMANSLELRVPFLDMKIFEMAKNIPTEYKITSHKTKYVLREAAKESLEKFSSTPKIYFRTPLTEWLKEEEYSSIIEKSFTSDSAKKFFNEDELLKYLNEHRLGKKNHFRKIWTLYTFLLWYEEFFVKR